MGRSPCCEKSGLKKGPWTTEEDVILTIFVNEYGHRNWRAIPQQAGLKRCGKSCRLRWMNYLRPDIKRGNLTSDEEEMIIKLHQQLGNKWAVIASSLPGRTDNEIKNVWNTHLKKRLKLTKIQPSVSFVDLDAHEEESSPETHPMSESPLENLTNTSQSFDTEVGNDFWLNVFSNPELFQL